MLTFIIAVFSNRKAIQQANRTRKALLAADAMFLLDVQDQAAAYGFAVGKGAPLAEVIDSGTNNPFLDPSWRDKVEKTS